MPIPKEKMRAFQEQQSDDNPDDLGGEVAQEEVPAEEDVSEEAQEQRKLDPQVAYMELKDEAGSFSCGTCISLQPGESEGEGVCINALVRAKVSASHGCCNLWQPTSDVVVVFPHAEGEEDEEREEEEEEPEDRDDEEDFGDEAGED